MTISVSYYSEKAGRGRYQLLVVLAKGEGDERVTQRATCTLPGDITPGITNIVRIQSPPQSHKLPMKTARLIIRFVISDQRRDDFIEQARFVVDFLGFRALCFGEKMRFHHIAALSKRASKLLGGRTEQDGISSN